MYLNYKRMPPMLVDLAQVLDLEEKLKAAKARITLLERKASDRSSQLERIIGDRSPSGLRKLLKGLLKATGIKDAKDCKMSTLTTRLGLLAKSTSPQDEIEENHF
jgi:hypothetical protein